MPAISKSQQAAAGLALSAKRGETSVSELKGSAKSMYDSMTIEELEEFAGTKTKGLPKKKAEKITEGKHKGKFRIGRN